MNNQPINEGAPRLMTQAFPTLFPDGDGDFYQTRTRKVSFGDYIQHLMKSSRAIQSVGNVSELRKYIHALGVCFFP